MIGKDDQIIYFANEYRLVTRAHLATLTGRNPKSLNESLRRLVRQRRLYSRTQGMYKPHVYATYDIGKRQHFAHDLPITDVHLALHKTGRLLEWQQRGDKRKDAINEDAVFYISVPLPDRIGRIKYYFEYDTGTEPLWQIDDKMQRYITLRREAQEPFNVLFICPERKRTGRLTSRAEKFIDQKTPASWKLFLFATLEDVLSRSQEFICTVAYDPDKYPLLPVLL